MKYAIALLLMTACSGIAENAVTWSNGHIVTEGKQVKEDGETATSFGTIRLRTIPGGKLMLIRSHGNSDLGVFGAKISLSDGGQYLVKGVAGLLVVDMVGGTGEILDKSKTSSDVVGYFTGKPLETQKQSLAASPIPSPSPLPKATMTPQPQPCPSATPTPIPSPTATPATPTPTPKTEPTASPSPFKKWNSKKHQPSTPQPQAVEPIENLTESSPWQETNHLEALDNARVTALTDTATPTLNREHQPESYQNDEGGTHAEGGAEAMVYPVESGMAPDYAVQPGDTVDVVFYKTQRATVDMKGDIHLVSLVGTAEASVPAAGKSPEEIARLAGKSGLDFTSLENPTIRVKVSHYAESAVIVLGGVRSPGRIKIDPDQQLSIRDIISRAGGLNGGEPGVVVMVRRGEKVIKIKLDSSDKDAVNALHMSPGDIVTVTKMHNPESSQ